MARGRHQRAHPGRPPVPPALDLSDEGMLERVRELEGRVRSWCAQLEEHPRVRDEPSLAATPIGVVAMRLISADLAAELPYPDRYDKFNTTSLLNNLYPGLNLPYTATLADENFLSRDLPELAQRIPALIEDLRREMSGLPEAVAAFDFAYSTYREVWARLTGIDEHQLEDWHREVRGRSRRWSQPAWLDDALAGTEDFEKKAERIRAMAHWWDLDAWRRRRIIPDEFRPTLRALGMAAEVMSPVVHSEVVFEDGLRNWCPPAAGGLRSCLDLVSEDRERWLGRVPGLVEGSEVDLPSRPLPESLLHRPATGHRSLHSRAEGVEELMFGGG